MPAKDDRADRKRPQPTAATEPSAAADLAPSLILLAAAAAALAFGLWYFRGSVVDDAYISFRYARNWIEGMGLVFNAGERVEGYTNLLWTMLIAAGLRLGADPESFARVAGWACVALSGALGFALASRIAALRRFGFRGLVVLLALTSPAVLFWAGAGLEAPCFMLLWVASRWALARDLSTGRTMWSALPLVLLPLCRPDGAIFVVTAIAVWWSVGRSRSFLAVVGFVAVAMAAYALWKLQFYGGVIPNTFLAKRMTTEQGFQLGLVSLGTFVRLHPWVLLAALEPVVAWLGGAGAKKENGEAGASALVRLIRWDCLLFGGYVVAVGSDSLPFTRFFVPLVLPLAILTALACARMAGLRAGLARTFGVALVGLACVSYYAAFTGFEAMWGLKATRVTRIGLVVGAYLDRVVPEAGSIAVNAAGAIPYTAKRTTVDMLGLNDAHIARAKVPPSAFRIAGHVRGDGAYVLSRRPDVIMLGNTGGATEAYYYSDFDLLRRPEFARDYQLVTMRLSQMPGGEAATRRTRVFASLGAAAFEMTDPMTGLIQTPVLTGLLPHSDYFTTDMDVHLFVRKDIGIRLP